MKQFRVLPVFLICLILFGVLPFLAEAKTVKVTLHAQEVDQPIDNKGTMYKTWTFDGKVPGPVVRVPVDPGGAGPGGRGNRVRHRR